LRIDNQLDRHQSYSAIVYYQLNQVLLSNNRPDLDCFHFCHLIYWVLKLDSTGNILWQNSIGGNLPNYLTSIQQASDGGYICGGVSISNISGDKTENNLGPIPTADYWIVKLDSSGIIEWQNTIGGNDNEALFSIELTNDGGYILGGQSISNISGDKTENSQGNYDYWVVKLTNQYNLIQGIEYADLNNNNIIDPTEPVLPYTKINEVNTGRFAITDNNGFYSLLVLDSGSFQVEPTLTNNYYNPNPTNYNINFSSILQIDSLNDFAFQPNGVFNDLCIGITPTGNFRSGMDASYIINYSNHGNTTLNASVVFYPDINLTYVSSSIVPTTISQDSIVFSIGSLTPFSNGQIVITMNVNLGLAIGSLINSGVTILPITGDANPICNQDWWEVFTTGAVDPNDILVSRDTIYNYELPSPPWIEYIIRFQNTGNDTAFFVRIENKIPVDLQLSEFEFINTSHPCSIEYLEYDSTMRFTFNNILLPDSSVNEVMSHGFIRYRIKPQNTLMIGDSIKNKASILFDYNAPVQTNTAITEIVLPTSLNEYFTGNISIYPNPVDDQLSVVISKWNNSKLTIELYNIYGQMVDLLFNGEIDPLNWESTFDVSSLSSGMYFIKVSGTTSKTTRFIKY